VVATYVETFRAIDVQGAAMKAFGCRITIFVALAMMSLSGNPTAAGQGVSAPSLDLHEAKLANGLRVIIVPDHSAPVYAICVTYNVGSRNELPGHTGFAHLFEHMMFQGSENVGKNEHEILVDHNGGIANGSTTEDRTNYYELFPKNQLDLGLFLESDRMRGRTLRSTASPTTTLPTSIPPLAQSPISMPQRLKMSLSSSTPTTHQTTRF
jgi:hypothetical protein